MNYGMVRYIIGKMLAAEALLMLIPAFVSLLYMEETGVWFIVTAAILGVLSLLLSKKPKDGTFYAKEGFLIVALVWVVWSAFGALPFVFSGSIPKYYDAFFETVSGFTTTGSTILTDIEALPRGINFWRCMTHWVGGMGVLVFVMAIIPLGQKNSMFLMRAEMPGYSVDKLVPKARSTARILYGMYLTLSIAETLLLMAGGLTPYEAITHTFSTAGTGGFSMYNSSVGAFDSVYVDGVITVFMLLFGVNFNLSYLLLLGNFKAVFKNEELRAYFGIVAGAMIAVTINLINYYGSVFKAFRYASFQVASIITTTGFVTANFDLWPEFSKTIILMLMIVGACAGSTGGGIKVSRLLILIKTVVKEIKQIIHPKSVNIVKMDGRRLDDETTQSVYVYAICYIAILFLSTLIISLDNFDFSTNFSAALTTLNNVGPGFAGVGAEEHFADFSWLSKLVLSFNMLVGRLEILPMVMLFVPQAWKKHT